MRLCPDNASPHKASQMLLPMTPRLSVLSMRLLHGAGGGTKVWQGATVGTVCTCECETCHTWLWDASVAVGWSESALQPRHLAEMATCPPHLPCPPRSVPVCCRGLRACASLRAVRLSKPHQISFCCFRLQKLFCVSRVRDSAKLESERGAISIQAKGRSLQLDKQNSRAQVGPELTQAVVPTDASSL